MTTTGENAVRCSSARKRWVQPCILSALVALIRKAAACMGARASAGGCMGSFGALRRLIAGSSLLLLATPILSALSASAAEAPPAASLPQPPAFVFESFHASNVGVIRGVAIATYGDIILLEGGYDVGFRNGMHCLVRDGDSDVGEIILVEVRNRCAAAIILRLEPGRIIEAGQTVHVKPIRF